MQSIANKRLTKSRRGTESGTGHTPPPTGEYSPLAAHQVILAWTILTAGRRDGDGLLETKRLDAGNDLLELLLSARTRVHDVDLFDRDHLHGVVVIVIHEGASIRVRSANWAKPSSD